MFAARFPGKCALCGQKWTPGTMLVTGGIDAYSGKRTYVHANACQSPHDGHRLSDEGFCFTCSDELAAAVDANDDRHEAEYDEWAAGIVAGLMAHAEFMESEPVFKAVPSRGTVTPTSDGYTVEASDLRLPVGVWPLKLELPTFPVFYRKQIQRDSDDVRGAVYATAKGTKLVVFND